MNRVDDQAEFVSALHPLRRLRTADPHSFSPEFLGRAPGSRTLASWFSTLGQLNRSAAGTSRFYQEAVQAIIDPGGLDTGFVLVHRDGAWESIAGGQAAASQGADFVPMVVERARSERMTLFHADTNAEVARFQESVVCAPVFADDGNVVAAIYATRCHRGANQRRGIRPLEALWIQLLAESVTSAQVRLAAEARAARTQVLLEQAFPEEVARNLLANPRALEGQNREVTCLFADLRHSSSLCETLSPDLLCELLATVLEELTEAIMQHDGVIIDYHGDGMAAMWNAPRDQPDHATRACTAAIDAVARVARLDRTWRSQLPCSLRLAMGVHTGQAIVGNTGTHHRIKYGPRGASINIASRLESAAKVLDIPILISADTARQLPACQFGTRRATATRLRGIPAPVQMFELLVRHDDSALNRIGTLEEVLRLLENGQLDAAEAHLTALLHEPAELPLPGDLVLLAQQIANGTASGGVEQVTLDLATY